MAHDEDLLQEAYDCGVEVIERYYFKSPRIKGLYSNKIIALNSSIKSLKEKTCILAEELGHYYLTDGDITNQTITANRKQEHKTRVYAYNKMIGLMGIVKAFEAGCHNVYEMAGYLDVTEEFMRDALDGYKSKYGEYAKLDNYIIYFEPTIGILKIL